METPVSKPELISCVMVTQISRLEHIRRAVACFVAQTYSAKELIIVSDGNGECHRAIKELVAHAGVNAKCVFVPGKASLGILRNVSLDAASGPIICQWDDDDQYLPERIALQASAMAKDGADVTFLTDQFHLYNDTGTLYWMDWRRDVQGNSYRLDGEVVAVPGTLMARLERLPRYPDAPIGEDSMLIESMPDGVRVGLIPMVGWTYLKVYHGENSWDLAQNLEITDHCRWRLTLREVVDWSRRIRETQRSDFDVLTALQEYTLPTGLRLTFGVTLDNGAHE